MVYKGQTYDHALQLTYDEYFFLNIPLLHIQYAMNYKTNCENVCIFHPGTNKVTVVAVVYICNAD